MSENVAIVVSGDSLWTYDEILMRSKQCRDHIDKKFAEIGKVRPACFLYATFDPKTKKPMSHMIVVSPPASDDAAGKELYAGTIQSLAVQHKAVASLFVSETFILKMASEAEAAERRKRGGTISNDPNRIRAIFVSLEHLRGKAACWIAMITPTLKPILGAWRQTDPVVASGGRFSSLLPRGH
jgi:hypothetical protein